MNDKHSPLPLPCTCGEQAHGVVIHPEFEEMRVECPCGRASSWECSFDEAYRSWNKDIKAVNNHDPLVKIAKAFVEGGLEYYTASDYGDFWFCDGCD